ncbi:hypothetical protein EVAR_32925_1 [Eumeta japonica]|uniref:Uncharacterized protein n=1 Tax=Eumeta variegata TaxID=151549 RepID=A0A4C1X6K9_EUMVA|nr:hypothetical protein EVAR_32925_1 [Eumeta japonica]
MLALINPGLSFDCEPGLAIDYDPGHTLFYRLKRVTNALFACWAGIEYLMAAQEGVGKERWVMEEASPKLSLNERNSTAETCFTPPIL